VRHVAADERAIYYATSNAVYCIALAEDDFNTKATARE
jgi:hypothetical protein